MGGVGGGQDSKQMGENSILTSKLVLLLYDEVGDGPAAVLHGPVPPQGHGLVVEVHDARLPRLARGLCTQKTNLKFCCTK
jgi:hypothetical protein